MVHARHDFKLTTPPGIIFTIWMPGSVLFFSLFMLATVGMLTEVSFFNYEKRI
jgi:hypothetical protein